MRIAVVLKDRCRPKRCALECINYCPPVRTGKETIKMGEDGKPIVAEELCVGCGICVHKCPFEALKIIGLAEALEKDLVHQFGKNGFRLFRLPIPKKNKIIGLLGPNGIGKTTVVNILSGQQIPNLGDLDKVPGWPSVLNRYAGSELYEYLAKLVEGGNTVAFKLQYVDQIPKMFNGTVRALLSTVDKTDKKNRLTEVSELLELESFLDTDIKHISGGELQRVAIAATLLRKADAYFFDEPSSYLDIAQRLKIARIIRSLVKSGESEKEKQGSALNEKEAAIMVIEHDLSLLDFLADEVHLLYGDEGAYGVVTLPRTTRVAINVYLSGYLKEENIRFRETEIAFESRPPKTTWAHGKLIAFDSLSKNFGTFSLTVDKGKIHKGEVVGIVGANATGKTTFVKMLAGVEKPDSGVIDTALTVSYKPQYIKPSFDGTVRELFYQTLKGAFDDSFYQNEVIHPLEIRYLMDKEVATLSGGELQRVAIALSLGRDADVYLIDEPSAYLDSIQRMLVAKIIRRFMENLEKSALIVDHDLYFIDLIGDSLMVFSGKPSQKGHGSGPYDMRTGMNRFLRELGITFRRDHDSNRPRINKENSALDREQKASGEYYYA